MTLDRVFTEKGVITTRETKASPLTSAGQVRYYPHSHHSLESPGFNSALLHQRQGGLEEALGRPSTLPAALLPVPLAASRVVGVHSHVFVEEDLKEGFEFFPRDARETVPSLYSRLAQLLI